MSKIFGGARKQPQLNVRNWKRILGREFHFRREREREEETRERKPSPRFKKVEAG